MFTPSRPRDRGDLGDARPDGRAPGRAAPRADPATRRADRAGCGGPRAPARASRAARAPSRLRHERRARRRATRGSRRARRRSRRGSATQMSGQIAGCPAAMRVMSRNPPAASRSSSACSLAAVGGDVHQRGRRELRHVAHDRHERVVVLGRDLDDLGAEPADHAPDRGVRGRGRCRRSGVSTHVAPANRSASAPSSPSCSEPAIGCPPTKRGASIRACRRAPRRAPRAFTEPTSVTAGAPASSASTTSSATRPTGTATITTSAPATASATRAGDRRDRAQLRRARAATSGVGVVAAHRRRRPCRGRARSSHR